MMPRIEITRGALAVILEEHGIQVCLWDVEGDARFKGIIADVEDHDTLVMLDNAEAVGQTEYDE